MHFGNTCTNRLCLKCSLELKCCKHCGQHLIKTRTKKRIVRKTYGILRRFIELGARRLYIEKIIEQLNEENNNTYMMLSTKAFDEVIADKMVGQVARMEAYLFLKDAELEEEFYHEYVGLAVDAFPDKEYFWREYWYNAHLRNLLREYIDDQLKVYAQWLTSGASPKYEIDACKRFMKKVREVA